MFNSKNYSYNSPKDIANSSDSSIFGLSISKIKNKTVISNKTKTKIYNKNIYNKLNFNKEKDDTKSQTNFISDNNYSTTNSFYNQKNKNVNKKLLSTIKLQHKLKNIITSIDYKDINNNKFKSDKKSKNIILYEFDRNGKINYKIKEIKNSVEKIVRDKSNSNSRIKDRNKIIDISPKKQGEVSLYVKKNQGTILRKYKNKTKIEFYNPYTNKLI